LLRLSDLQAEWVELDALSMLFGSTRLTNTGEATFAQVTGTFEQTDERTRIELASHGVHAAKLSVDINTVRVRGDMRLQGMRLAVDGGEGEISATQASIENFELRVGELLVSAPQLSGEGIVIGWGERGFRLQAKVLNSPALTLEVGDLRLDAEKASFEALRVQGGDVSFARANLESARLDASLTSRQMTYPPRPKPAAVQPPGAKPKRVFAWQLLDGLSGDLHVDAVVDMTVPIIGQRRATHKLRLRIEDGAIDYRELEAGLSALEESLLDFSVREDSLVLERGIPLLPTRGFGKRLLVWELGPSDLALAHKRKIRVAVLPEVKLAPDLAKANEAQEPGSSSFALRRLGLENMALSLALSEADTAMPSAIEHLSFERLSASGNLQHELSGEARPGIMSAQLEKLETRIAGLRAGDSRVDVESLQLQSLRNAALSFRGLVPHHLEVEIVGLTMTNLVFASEPSLPPHS
jgi:hypothetical protein